MATLHVMRQVVYGLIFSGLLGVLMAGQTMAGTIGTTAVTPNGVAVGTATTVTVTALITDPSVIPSSVVLQSLDSRGRVIATLGNFHDDDERVRKLWTGVKITPEIHQALHVFSDGEAEAPPGRHP